MRYISSHTSQLHQMLPISLNWVVWEYYNQFEWLFTLTRVLTKM